MTDAIVLMAGIIVGPLKVGYSYDITTSALKNHSSNTHELMISFCHRIVSKRPPTNHVWDRHMELKPHPSDYTYLEGNCNLYKAMNGYPNMVQ